MYPMASALKEVEIKARITSLMREAIEAIAEERGESVSLIVREALLEYLHKRNGALKQMTDRDAKRTFEGIKKIKAISKEKRSYRRDVREVSLSIFGTIPAGWPDARHSFKPKRTIMVSKGRYPSDAFGLDVLGDSMDAAKGKLGPILPGETVVLAPFTTADEAAGKIVAAMIDGHTTLKRLVCPKGGDCYLRAESNNPVFAGVMHPLHDLEVQGVVVSKLDA